MIESSPRTGPKDVFLQLLAMGTLYVSVVELGVLLFQLINRWFPDPLTGGYGSHWGDGASGALRWSLATLIIVFPVYVWMTWMTERDLARNPDKRRLKTRRWLLYLTLLIAAVTIIGDLVALVRSFLWGELTIRFLLKALTVLVIAATTFIYYRAVLRRDDDGVAPPWMVWLGRAAIVLAAAAMVTGFIVHGLPQSQRLRRFDDRRVGNLQSIQSNVVTYWRQKGALPPSLDALRDSISGYVAPVDPQTGQPYEYRVTGPLAFELCATFRTSTIAQDRFTGRKPAPYPIDELGEYGTWPHEDGRTCFTRTIDPARYPTRRVPPVPVQPAVPVNE